MSEMQDKKGQTKIRKTDRTNYGFLKYAPLFSLMEEKNNGQPFKSHCPRMSRGMSTSLSIPHPHQWIFFLFFLMHYRLLVFSLSIFIPG